MKNKLTLFATSAVIAFAGNTLCAVAYEANEHLFFQDANIKSMSQEAGNGYCRVKFDQLKATGDLGGGFDPNAVNHVWAHIGNGECIANT